MKVNIVFFILFCWGPSVYADLVKDKNNISISEIELQILLETAPVKAQKALLQNKKKVEEQLEQLYLRKVMALEAKKEGLDKEVLNKLRLQAVVDNKLYLFKLKSLKESNTKDYSKFAKYLYSANQSDYQVGERVDATHILISTKELSDEEALKKIESIRKQLLAGANFTELAVQNSDDKSVKKNKGELGTFTRNEMVKPFTDTAFSMQVGEISTPVKTRFGYHLIKLNKKIPKGVKSFDEVKESIVDKLKKKDWNIDILDYYKNMTTRNKMKIDSDVLDDYLAKKLIELDE